MPPYLRLVRTGNPRVRRLAGRPTPIQLQWLRRGLDRPGGNLPMFDDHGQRVNDRTVKSCLDRGWAETRAEAMRDWQLCQLTSAGRQLLDADQGS